MGGRLQRLLEHMIDIKDTIESKLVNTDRMSWMYKKFDTFTDSKSVADHYIKTSTTKTKVGKYYDIDEYIVTIVSKDAIGLETHVRSVVDSVKSMEDNKSIIKVLFKGTVEYKGYVEVVFNLINNIDKTVIKEEEVIKDEKSLTT